VEEKEKKETFGGQQTLPLVLAILALLIALVAVFKGGTTKKQLQVLADAFSKQIVQLSVDKIQRFENEMKAVEIKKIKLTLKELEPELTQPQQQELQKVYQSLDDLEAQLSGTQGLETPGK